MKKITLIAASVVAPVTLVAWAPTSEAYPTYTGGEVFHPAGSPRCRDTDVNGCEEPSGNCKTCHGHFRATDEDNSRPYLRDEYVSPTDGKTWREIYQEVEATEPEEEVGLHDIHRHIMVDKIGRSRCNVCHLSTGRYPVFLDFSAGGEGLDAVFCLECHGRFEEASGQVTGAGLRQHHANAGVPVCKTCHEDADPVNYVPVGEDVPPPYYFTPDPVFPNKPTDPCSQNGEEDYAGGPKGLDNDRDGRYDMSDHDCQWGHRR